MSVSLRLAALLRERGRPRVVVIAVAVAAVVLAAWGFYAFRDQYGEQTDGPHGSYPAGFGKGAPARPAGAELRDGESYGVLGGLSVDPLPGRDGVSARSLRTGDTYWTYRREGVGLAEVALGNGFGDRPAGSTRLLALWWEDGLVVALDPESGEARWHAEGTEPAGGAVGELTAVEGRGTVLAADGEGITAYDGDDGHRLWRHTPPAACRLDSGQLHALRSGADPGVYTVRERCPAATDHPVQLAALDAGSGTERWRLPMGDSPVLQVDSHRLVTLSWAGRGRGAVVEYGGKGRPSVKEIDVADEHTLRDVSGDLLTTDRSVLPARLDMVADLGTRGSRWVKAPARGTRFGVPLLVEGRVYVVQQPERAKAGPNVLRVLDAGSGKLLHELALPDVPAEGEAGTLDVVQVRDGAVVMRRDGGGEFRAVTGRLVVAH
ncbi:PQQ-binding-like beta-propeller repeat protein [Streptomyces sp. NPDC051940]|uniref:outer membrane protein assembly factor BamB family protein n=1 Tax=Streptomyces sp. NPDC051940 TaxID=3155675 RepID=UPI00342D744A